MEHLQTDLLAWLVAGVAGISLYSGFRLTLQAGSRWDTRHTVVAVPIVAAFVITMELANQRPDGWIIWSLGVIVGGLAIMLRGAVEIVQFWLSQE